MSAADVVIFDEAAAASSSAPSDAPPPTTAGKKIRQQRWVCDVCKVKWFLDFKEACAHEASCDGGTPPTSQGSSQSSSAASVAKEVAGEVSLISADSNDGIGAKKRSGKAGTSSSFTAAASAPKQSEEQVAAVIAAARARRAKKNANAEDSTPVAVPLEGEELQASNLVDTDEDDGNSSLEEGMSLKRSERGRRSKRLRDAPSKPPPLKDSNTSSNASNSSDGTSEKKGKKSKAPKESTMGSKGSKSSSKSEDTSCAHSSKSGEKKKSAASKPSKPSSKTSKPSSKTTGAGKSSKSGGGQLASIFLSKKGAAASKKEPKKGKKATDEVLPGVSREDYEEHLAAEKEAAQRKKKRAVNYDGKAKKGKQPLKRRKKPAKEEVVDIDSSSDEDSAESDGEYADKPKPKAKGKAKAAKNFLSKKQLAEHQAADFFAKRKQKAAEERERQKKREEARLARMNGRAEGKDAGNSFKDAATAGGGSASGRKATGIPAPRFPYPSHVAADDGGTDSPNAVSGASSALTVLREKPRYPHMKSDLSASADESENAPSLGFSTKADRTDQTGMSSALDLLSSVFERRDGNQSDVEGSRLWTDKHSNLQDPDDILAEENIGAVHTLTSFVEEWKVRRHKAVQVMGQLKRKKKRRRKKSGYDSDDSFIDDGPGGLESLFLITGPTGSGKTRLVHAVAEQMECAVIEINSSGVRSGAALKRAIQETTQSHSSLAVSRKKQKNGANNFFGKTCKADESEEEEDSDGYSDESDEESVRESHSLTVILIDEVDLLFDEDTAFWPALAQLSQKAKCPIVLTATSAPEDMNNFRYKGIALKRANPQECADRMAQVSHDEGMIVREGIEPEEKTRRLSLIAEVCGCDMRKILNEMQLFHLGGSQRSSGSSASMDNLWPQSSACSGESTSPSTFLDDEPLILSVEPRLVPRATHTLITIKGKNFASTTFPSQSGEAERVELLMGGKPCSHYRIVSDSKIVAVCPPCAVPSGVSKESLIYEKSMQLDCMTCKFADVVVRKRCSNGLMVESKDTSSLRWNIEYDIPLRDSAWEEKRSRAEFIREAKARKEAREMEMAGDGDELMSSDEEEFEGEEPAPAPSPSKDIGEKAATEVESEEQEPEVKVVDPQTLLDDAIASLESPQEAPSNKASLGPEDQSPSLVELKEFSVELDRLSDAVLLEDSLTTLAVPSLSGAVEGFGSNALESSANADPSIDKLCKGKNKKPPSIDTIYSTGVNETGFFFGAGDSFMTHLPRRDRHLLSYSERSSRSLGHLVINRPSEDNAENSKSGLNDEDDEDSPFFQPPTRARSEDDILLNPHLSPALMSLPALLEQGLASLRKNGFTREQTPLLQSRGGQRAIKAFEFMQDAVGGFRNRWLRVWLNDSLVGGPLSLDYLPFLRAIAKHEDSARKRVEDMLKENGDAQLGGRMTRRSKKSNMRQHYLEAYAGPEWKERAIEARSTELAAHYLE